MRYLPFAAALLLAFGVNAHVHAVEVPSQADHDALSGRVGALEGALPSVLDRLEALEGATPPPPVEPPAGDPPSAVAGANLQDCVAQLVAQGGGWCEMKVSEEHPSISSVWPAGLTPKQRMNTGTSSILIAWTGMAFDRARMKLYFFGGGHADYGGNEVYEFDLASGTWTRLTDPDPLNFLFETAEARYCWAPDLRRQPASVHTYDGIQFSSATDTLFVVAMDVANGACFTDESFDESDPALLADPLLKSGIYEFNPSRTESRNGLDPLTWRRVSDASFSYPRALEFPDGSLMLGNRTSLYPYDPVANNLGDRNQWLADYGDGTIEHLEGDTSVTAFGAYLVFFDHASRKQTAVVKIPVPASKSVAVRGGLLYFWNGRDKVFTYDRAVDEWRLFDYAGLRTADGHSGATYSKWQYLPEHDVFVGLSHHSTGVWVYRHPASEAGVVVGTVNPQAIVNQANAGDTVTIPPGAYFTGLIITRPLTLNLAGVRLMGVAGQKGVINVNCDGCEVVINDFTADGVQAGCQFGNCSGIKVEGIDFNLTVNNAHIAQTVNCILTDNRGGTLRVNDSLLEGCGRNSQAHGIYAGDIDLLELDGVTIRGIAGSGHVLKSRALATIVRNSRLYGPGSLHSRMVDLSCGGDALFDNTLIHQGDQTDNAELMSYAPEVLACGDWYRPNGTLTLRDTTVISDRDHSADERARNYGATTLVKWYAPSNDPAQAIRIEGATTFTNIAQMTFATAGFPALPLP